MLCSKGVQLKMNSVDNNASSNTTAINRRTTSATRNEVKQSVNGNGDKKTPAEKPAKPIRWVQLRMIPIWLRIIIVVALVAVAMFVGYDIGYSVIGDGDSSNKVATLRHMLDIINGKE